MGLKEFGSFVIQMSVSSLRALGRRPFFVLSKNCFCHEELHLRSSDTSISVSHGPVPYLMHAFSHQALNLSQACHIACRVSAICHTTWNKALQLSYSLHGVLQTATYLYHCAFKISTLIRMLTSFTGARWFDNVGL